MFQLHTFLRKCNADQKLFGDLTLKVNKILREESEKMMSLMVLQWFTNFETKILTSLANNETKVDILLERIWEQFATFTEHVTFEKKADIMNYLSKELITSENKCLKNDYC